MDAQFVSWNWIAPIAVSVLILIGGYIINNIRTAIDNLQERKLDKAEFIREHAQLRATIESMDVKLDTLKDIMLRHVGSEIK